MTTVDIRPAHRFGSGETLVKRDLPLEVFAEGDALFDAMLRDINLAQRSVRLDGCCRACFRRGAVPVRYAWR